VVYDSSRQVVWFGVDNVSRVCSLNSSGTVVCHNVPTSAANMAGMCYDSVGDKVYFTEGVNKVGQYDPVGNSFAEWTIPEASSSPAGCQPFNSKIYFVETATNKIQNVNSAGTFGTAITVGSFPHGPTIGLDGKFWFCLFSGNQIGNIDTSGTYTATNLPQSSSGCGVTTPAVYQSVNQECFTENTVNKIGCIPIGNQTTGAITQFNIPTATSNTWGITTGADGNLYFGERDTNIVGMVTMATGKIVNEWPLPNGGTSPNKICLAFSNYLVFTEHVTDNVDVLNVKPIAGGSKATGTFTGSVQ
jgi:virginiamycin B lyase